MSEDAPTFATIEYRAASDGDPIARIILNRPDKRNPIGALTCGELIAAFSLARRDSNARVLVVTGAGKVFSAGGDLSAFTGQPGPREASAPPASLPAVLSCMHQLGMPIIAMVNGHALAGGLGLMVACDLVIASDEATFGTTEVRVGLWPMMITAELVRNVGRKMALELMLTGRRIDATEAKTIGLINRAVPLAELESATTELAKQIAANSPMTMAMGLRAFYKTQDLEFSDALTDLEAQLGLVLQTPDAAEGLAAFFAKRAPVWQPKRTSEGNTD